MPTFLNTFVRFSFLLCAGVFCVLSAHAERTQTFTITGYYSPLPNQNFYVTGDYQSEIRLNGKGIQGADGTPVYPGMIAASPSYAFGTKVCVPGFGCGAVHDRGQAIVNQGERSLARHDRLDLWMGYGEQGLLRALAWGVKHIDCTVYPSDSPVKEGVNFVTALPLNQILDIGTQKEYPENLRHGDEGDLVRELQEDLAVLGFYNGIVDGRYDFDVKNAVFRFQKKYFLIEASTEVGAGMFGPMTRETLSDQLYKDTVQRKLREAWDNFHFDEVLSRGARNPQVVKLQRILTELEYFTAYPTGFFGPQTQKAVIAFQVAEELIEHAKSPGAGRVGPLTQERLNELVEVKRSLAEAEQAEIVAYQKSRERMKYLAGKNLEVLGVLSLGDYGESVVSLQSALKQLGYIDDVNGSYDQVTQRAIQKFQLDNGVIFSAYEQGAGVYGPYTQSVLMQIVNG